MLVVLQTQVNHVDEWLCCLRSTFEAMDADKDGRLKPNEILEALRAKLPEAEVSLECWESVSTSVAGYWQGLCCFQVFLVEAMDAEKDGRPKPNEILEALKAAGWYRGPSVLCI
jgi:Ca2+-binding EF-hand superfamily protein